MWRWALLVSAIAALCSASALYANRGPARLASNNLCSDQYLLAFGTPETIVAVSPLAKDGTVSLYADKAANFPSLADATESALTLAPDVLLSSVYARPAAQTLLLRHGIQIETVPESLDISHLGADARGFGLQMGWSNATSAFADRFERRWRETADAFAPYHLKVLITAHGGYVQQPDSVTGQVLDHLGVENGVDPTKRFAVASVEEILNAKPDILVFDDVSEAGGDSQTGFHPSLRKLYPASRTLSVPATLTLCTGPSTLKLLDYVFERLTAIVAAQQPR